MESKWGVGHEILPLPGLLDPQGRKKCEPLVRSGTAGSGGFHVGRENNYFSPRQT